MSNNVLLIRPVAISAGSALVTSSSVGELTPTYDPAAWDPATAYVIGDQVGRSSNHKIYQRRVDGTTATAPEDDTTNWAEVGVTNKWKPFDDKYQTQAQAANSASWEITPGEFADSVIILNAECETARVQAADGYDETVQMYTRTVLDWFDYFYEPFSYRQDAAFLDVNLSTTDPITITLENTGGVVKVGEIKIGLAKDIGVTELGAATGFDDYSLKTEDEWGSLTLTEGPYAKEMSINVLVQNDFIDELHRLAYRYRATPIVLLGAGSLYECLMAYGYIESFRNVIKYDTASLCAIDFKALT